jgi:serine/threonine-protein kinase
MVAGLQIGRVRTGPASLLVLLLIYLMLAVVGSEFRFQVESFYYGLFQRQHSPPAADQLVLIDYESTGEEGATGWSSERVASIVDALATAGASQIVLTMAPAAGGTAGLDFEQLQSLIRLEERARTAGAAFSSQIESMLPGTLSELRAEYAAQQSLIESLRRAGNVYLAMPSAVSKFADAGPCLQYAAPVSGEISLRAARSMRRAEVSSPAPALCQAAAAIGHVEYWSDADGVVRSNQLVARAGSAFVPALALIAVGKQAGALDGGFRLEENGKLAFENYHIKAGGGFAILNRHYDSQNGASAFFSVTAAELLGGQVGRDRIRGRIAVIGPIAPTASNSFRTPSESVVSRTTLVATSMANLLDGEFVVRTAWLPWLELLLPLLGVGALLAVGAVRNVLGRVALVGGLAGLCIAIEALLITAAGVWVQIITPALMVLLGGGCMEIMRGFSTDVGHAAVRAADALQPGSAARIEELDARFAGLREQRPTEETKEQLYGLAVEYARARQLQGAERVLQHLTGLDPQFRGAEEKLAKLAGRRRKPADDEAEIEAELVPEEPQETGGRASKLTGEVEGTRLGRYVLESVLGKGAMATVYLGRDPSINRQLAIKTLALSDEFEDEELEKARAQFLREAESAGRLNHPNIILIYDVGEEDGLAYLAMEYFSGVPLSEHTRPHQLLPAKWVLELTAQAALALHYAHCNGVVHRDIKPANLLYDASSDTLKITDFGIARLTDTRRTKTGLIMGTPSYMPPEQLRGDPVTARADIYSLGVTIYELLTGALPFRGDSLQDLLAQIVRSEPEPVSTVMDELPASLDSLLERALAKDPEQRFANGREMAMALLHHARELGKPETGQTAA